MELKRIVVTGLGAVTPLGNDVESTWNSLVNGVSGAGPITLFDASLFKTKFACEVKNFDPSQYIDRKEARKLDRYAALALSSAVQAVEDAAFDMEKLDKDRVGVVYSAGIGGLKTFEEEVGYYFQHQENGPRFSPFFIPKIIVDIAAGHISMRYGFRGPNYATVSACASSTNAIIDAFNLLRLGKADVIVTGGAEAGVNITGIGGFNAMHALSTRNDSPQTASRPFSASRDGFVLGEGAACLVLEELNHALARGAKIYAEVIGGGMSADAYHLTVDYINVHGTSTPVGDISEVKAIKAVFGEHAKKINISSTKSMSGHLLGAAGAFEALVCVKTVENDIIPPTINHEEGDNDPEIDYSLNYTFNKAQKRTVNIALSNTFGFGGHNASLIVKKFVK